jgi:hypothetical protein
MSKKQQRKKMVELSAEQLKSVVGGIGNADHSQAFQHGQAGQHGKAGQKGQGGSHIPFLNQTTTTTSGGTV